MLNHLSFSSPDSDPVDALVTAWAAKARLQPAELSHAYSAISTELERQIGLRVANEVPQRMAASSWLAGVGLAKQVVKWAASRSWQTWPQGQCGELRSREPATVAWGNAVP
jgi:hypothetical protein